MPCRESILFVGDDVGHLSSSSIHLIITHRIPMQSQINSLSLSISPNTEFDSDTNELGCDHNVPLSLLLLLFRQSPTPIGRIVIATTILL
mmetsp:Transcript_66443/g.74435  ORF Transcript_66443/g.74435 Transcript_66443/m.74435 type:complete len:90 (+) Transcript_66443:184-453(+)